MGSSGGSQRAASFDPTVDLYELMVYSEGSIAAPGALYPGFIGDAHIQAGEPGWLIFNIPITHFEVTGHQDVAEDGRTAFNPEATPKPETRVHLRINRGGNYFPLLSGTVVERIHDVATDSVSLKIVDDLYQLSKFSILGRYIARTSSSIFFDSSKPCTFNMNGWPDCMDTTYGPLFAPEPRYGWVPSDTTEPQPGQALYKARSWRITDVITYLCNTFDESTSGLFAVASAAQEDLKPTPLPEDWITFTSDIAASLTLTSTDFAANSASETARKARVVHNYECDGKALLLMLNELAAMAGPFLPYAYASEGKSKIMFLSLTPTLEKTKLSIEPGVSSLQAGGLKESSEKWYGFSTIVGNPPVIERMVSTDCGTVTSSLDSGATSVAATSLDGAAMGTAGTIRSGSLIPKWSAADETAFKQFIIDASTAGGGVLPVDEAFKLATKQYPFVYCAYGVSGEFNYLLGTKYANLATNLPRIPPVIQKYLVSGRKILYDASQSTGLGTWAPYEITIECFIDPADPKSTTSISATTNVWSNVSRDDGLQVSADGTYFMLPALRDSANHPTFRGDVSTLADSTALNALAANHVRCTIAVIPPFRIYATDATDPNKIGGRMAPAIYPQFLAAPNSDYTEWLRINSYPWGKHSSVFDTGSDFPIDSNGKLDDACTDGAELFSDVARITDHAKARNRRNNWIYATGNIVTRNYEPGYSVGAKLSEIGNIEAGGTITSVTFNQASQTISYGFS